MKTGWTIGRKMIVSFMCVAALTLLLGLVGFYGAVKSGESITELGVVRLPSVQSLLVVSENAERIKSAQRTLLNPGATGADRKRQMEIVAKAREEYQTAWKVYEPLPQTVEEAALWKEFVPAWGQWRKDNEAFFKINGEREAMGIANPAEIQRDLQQFIGDHHKLTMAVLDHVTHGTECKGGDDPTACNYGKWMTKFESTNPELKRIVDDTRPSHAAYHAAVKQAKELAAAGDKEGGAKIIDGELKKAAGKTFEGFAGLLAEATKAAELEEKLNQQGMIVCRASQAKALGLLDKIVEINMTVAADATKASTAQSGVLKTVTITAMIAGVVLAMGLGIFVSRGINKSLSRIADTLAAGAEQTASAAGQVSSSSQSLAQGASEQAASLEETSSSLEEMSSMTKKNAQSAQQASTLSAEAKHAADQGNQAMDKMSSAINEIQKSAAATAKIIKVIDEIAFQTNLLALNAAVEAARAGEAGKGFAVVAEEVRNLAMRSAEAAKNTASMIEESVQNAKNGVAITTEVAKSLQEITGAATKVNALVGEISAASQEQTTGIDQVNTAVSQMDKVTQSNAANAEESASASEELSSQAEQMKGMVGELIAMVNGASARGTGATSGTAAPAQSTRRSATATRAGKAKNSETIVFDSSSASQGDFGAFNKAA